MIASIRCADHIDLDFRPHVVLPGDMVDNEISNLKAATIKIGMFADY